MSDQETDKRIFQQISLLLFCTSQIIMLIFSINQKLRFYLKVWGKVLLTGSFSHISSRIAF